MMSSLSPPPFLFEYLDLLNMDFLILSIILLIMKNTYQTIPIGQQFGSLQSLIHRKIIDISSVNYGTVLNGKVLPVVVSCTQPRGSALSMSVSGYLAHVENSKGNDLFPRNVFPGERRYISAHFVIDHMVTGRTAKLCTESIHCQD